jgi:mono/diheme cytochrome c family protein
VSTDLIGTTMHRTAVLALFALAASTAIGMVLEPPMLPISDQKEPTNNHPVADDPPAPPPRSTVDFTTDVQPILAANCSGCHGPDKQRGGLRLDRKADALRGGDSGKVIVPGKPGESLLLKKVAAADANDRMPKGRDPLTAEQIRTLSSWIEAGAGWPAEAPADALHWAFKPVKRPTVPGTRNPIDYFIAAKLSDRGLSLSPEADRRTLIRRLKFDLLGLPPTPEEVEAFVSDQDPNAYEKLVDRYLAGPQFGERWARHWLDVVRFAESNGFETNQPRPNAYHYRDYVIKAFNDDKPYDQFVREQLAGDTLGADAATAFLVGGAVDEVRSPDVTLTLNQRADELHDMVGTTGSTFLGLTVACARCHAHKFDPIAQLDYYQLKAVFAGVQHGERPIRDGDERARKKEEQKLREQLTEVEAQLAALEPLADPAAPAARRTAVNPRLNSERFKPVKAKFIRFVIFETNTFEPCIDELEVFTGGPNPVNVALASAGAKATSSGNYPNAPSIHRLEFIHDGKYGNGRSWISNKVGRGWVEIELPESATIERIVWARDREGKFTDRLATRYRIDVSTDRESWVVVASSDDRTTSDGSAAGAPPALNATDRASYIKLNKQVTSLSKQLADLVRGQMVYAGRMGPPEVTYRLHRGDATQQKEVVGPGVLSEIGPKFTIPATATDPERRAALAKWITDPTHPLTARVIVNRLWQHHFGVGIVDTPSDFGKNGGTPTNPELLDWLASELANPDRTVGGDAKLGGDAKPWGLKHIHRLIVTSATYRQSSAANAAGLAKDAQARLLWRYPPQRIEAEALRDAVLFVSGKIDLTMGGPGFDLFEPNTNYVKVYTPKTEFGPGEFRRMIYQFKPRMQLDDTFGAFDCPDAGQITPRRNVSTTPLQALNLLNSSFMLQQARYFAERAERDAGADPTAQIKRVFGLAFQRPPTEKELTAATKLVKEHGLVALCRAVLNANEFVFVD